ncbi:hypothetical protein BIV60_10355 [Bacillus sp. MUM 116]|uniref:hypothetical protein n=1 Tax=Bacillus sp. MUM 116 TaxID=1678002 RepID=UPI0008F5F0E9|nr:hypothetical protein [Bacillus sp. MUM 116]OIK15121.1 hypothetical protein BIV60_10355 [Bacillus sp. MUM 116]
MKEENKPFNDVIDHMNKNRRKFCKCKQECCKKVPKTIKIFWVFYGWLLINIHLVNDYFKFIPLTILDS